MGKVAAWWNRFGYIIFPYHQKELDNINKISVDLKGELAAERERHGKTLVELEAVRKKLKLAEAAYQRPQPVQRPKTAAELRRLMEVEAQKEGEGDGV